MARVFLSHSSADSAGAKTVAQLLRNAGLAVWLDLDCGFRAKWGTGSD